MELCAADLGLKDFHLDFIFSNELTQVENGMGSVIRGILVSKMAPCIALANVKQKALYKQIGIGSFREYLSSNRIHLSYQTAHEYSKIGEAYLRHRVDLLLVDFQEECGLKKLLLIESALRKHDRNAVFLKLMHSSYREFKRFAYGERSESARADSALCNAGLRLSMEEDEECILLSPSGPEIVWFNNELPREVLTPETYRRLKKIVFVSVLQFLHALSEQGSRVIGPVRN